MRYEVLEEYIKASGQEDENGRPCAEMQLVFKPGASAAVGLVRGHDQHQDVFILSQQSQITSDPKMASMAGSMAGKTVIIDNVFEASEVQRIVVPKTPINSPLIHSA